MKLYENISVCVKCLYISFCLIINISFFINVASAQPEEEMRILRMYFMKDELVITPQRTPKHLSQVAENVSIVTAKDIENMNAHTVADVIEGITGFFVTSLGHDFGSNVNARVQGSESRHVLVLLDGMPWNMIGDEKALLNSIPVRIIRRIEIIKGPASSSWGSSLGGVINIVTKDTGTTEEPSGSVSASYGESNTQDYRAEVSGKAGFAGYYLFAGRQDTDGLKNNRYFENNMFYSKLNFPINSGKMIMLTAGYTEPENNFLELPEILSWKADATSHAFFVTSSYSSKLTSQLDFDASAYLRNYYFVSNTRLISDNSLIVENKFDEKTIGGGGKIVWKPENHTVVLGVDISDSKLEETKLDDSTVYDSNNTKWAIYVNDTISMGALSITPGIRYDDNNVYSSFTSPSIGITYKYDVHILKANVARGFSLPPSVYVLGGGFNNPNSSLKPETVWSYQLGLESRFLDMLRSKIIVFHHNQNNAIDDGDDNDFVNKGDIEREGIEIELETAPYNYTSFKTGLAYVRIKSDLEDNEEDKYAGNVTVTYDDRKSFLAQLAGNYIWYDPDIYQYGAESGILWNLNLRKKAYLTENLNADIFLSAHNIFNANQYFDEWYENPGRWFEAGVRMNF